METTDASVREIATESDFEAAKALGAGLFVVTDRSTPTRVHALTCYAVGIGHFRTKVIANGRKRGRYFFAPSADVARARFPKGLPCGLCRPFPASPRAATPGTPSN